MSEKLTSIQLRDLTGWSEWGYVSREHIIKRYRENAQAQKEEAEQILAAADSEFEVCQHRGVYAWRDVKTIS